MFKVIWPLTTECIFNIAILLQSLCMTLAPGVHLTVSVTSPKLLLVVYFDCCSQSTSAIYAYSRTLGNFLVITILEL